MFSQDLLYIFTWWSVFFLLGAIFFPLTSKVFKSFSDHGYIFAKVIGVLVLTYLTWIMGIVKIAPFSQTTLFGILLVLIVINIFYLLVSLRGGVCSTTTRQSKVVFFIVLEEIIFTSALFLWSWVKGHQPDLQGLEKFMDFGFINSLLRTKYFPPLDMWLTNSPTYTGGFFINYYYFGHLVTAVLTKLTAINPAIAFNLMLATIFAFCFTGSFSIGINLLNNIHLEGVDKRHLPGDRMGSWKVVLSGLLTGFLVTLAGNLHTIYAFFKPYIPADKAVPFWQLPLQLNFSTYWYPNATRFIPFTIHEFPSYSFVVSDLHGHVLDIPFVLLTIALLLSMVLSPKHPVTQIQNSKSTFRQKTCSKQAIPNKFQLLKSKLFGFLNFDIGACFEFDAWNLKIILLGFLLAIMYMTNAWDGIIYFGLSGLVFLYTFYRNRGSKNLFGIPEYLINTFYYAILLLVLFAVFSLPFQLHFKPFVFGIGVVRDHSPLWMLAILWGFFYFCVAGFVISLFHRHSGEPAKGGRLQNHSLLNSGRASLARMTNSLSSSDIFVLLMILLSTALLIFPEFFYVKDIYPLHYRANTMFKLGYQAFVMLSLTSGYIIIKIFSHKPHIVSRLPYTVYSLLLTVFLFLVSIYPYFSINSYFGNLKTYKGLYGLSYLERLYPKDYQAILWLQNNIQGQPVILEAVGDSYTDYSRVSANTGLPTVLGWPVHEWLWRGSFNEAGKRVDEVKKAYTTDNLKDTKSFLKKYNVQFVFIGQLEHQKYPELNEAKFTKIGKIIYQSGETKIYKLSGVWQKPEVFLESSPEASRFGELKWVDHIFL